ncbi:MAG: serine/threonine-protein kinase [Planctomycetota bacterium]|jgi:predicted Ser/Thr protein kinase
MSTALDDAFGRIALERRAIDPRELARCRALHADRLARGEASTLASVCVREGAISEADAEELRHFVLRATDIVVREEHLEAAQDGDGIGDGDGEADGDDAAPPGPVSEAVAKIVHQNTRMLRDLSSRIAEPDPNRTFHKYEIVSELSRGGMGVVYRARHPDLGHDVALKVVRDDDLPPNSLDRFRKEAEILAKLNHPAIVPVHDAGVWDGRPYFTMDLIDGHDLEDHIRHHGPMATAEALELLATIADALDHAHSQGVIHRDVKPANILVNDDLRPYLTDFGLALDADVEHRLTQSGTALGTPLYMAPEQAHGSGHVDQRADVYSLGAVAYELLSGVPPFRGENLAEVIHAVIERDPAPLEEVIVGLPRDVITIVEVAMAKMQSQRYETAAALAADCRAALEGKRIAARPLSRVERAGEVIGRHRGKAFVFALLGAAAAGAVGALLLERLLGL